MVFPTASTHPRPIRLNEQIRDWAWRSMHGEFGDDAMTHMAVSLDHLEDYIALEQIRFGDPRWATASSTTALLNTTAGLLLSVVPT